MEEGEGPLSEEIYRLILQAQEAQIWFQIEVKIGSISVNQVWVLTLSSEATTDMLCFKALQNSRLAVGFLLRR